MLPREYHNGLLLLYLKREMSEKMKYKPQDWDHEKKLHRVEKGTNKAGKHRKSIYNMLSDYDKEFDEYDSDDGEVVRNYNGKFSYGKRR